MITTGWPFLLYGTWCIRTNYSFSCFQSLWSQRDKIFQFFILYDSLCSRENYSFSNIHSRCSQREKQFQFFILYVNHSVEKLRSNFQNFHIKSHRKMFRISAASLGWRANKNRFKIFAAADFESAALRSPSMQLTRTHENSAYIIGTDGV